MTPLPRLGTQLAHAGLAPEVQAALGLARDASRQLEPALPPTAAAPDAPSSSARLQLGAQPAAPPDAWHTSSLTDRSSWRGAGRASGSGSGSAGRSGRQCTAGSLAPSLRGSAASLHWHRSFAASCGVTAAALAARPSGTVISLLDTTSEVGSLESLLDNGTPGSFAGGSGSSGSSSSSGSGSALDGSSSSNASSIPMAAQAQRVPGHKSASHRLAPRVSPEHAAILEAAGGDAQQLLGLLRQHRHVELFNAALRSVPDAQLPAVLDALVECAAAAPRCTPNLRTADALLQRAADRGSAMRWEVDRAMRRLLAAGLPPHYSLFLRWATLHAGEGSIQGVRHVMQQLEEACGAAAVLPHYYVQLVRAYCARGRWRDAEPLLGEMAQRGVPPTEHVYRALIWCMGRHHRADRARTLFDDMVSSGIEPSEATWAALLNAYADSKQPFRAVEALRTMRAQGIAATVQAYGALTKAFARSGDWRRAHEVVELMQAEGLAPNEQIYGCVIEAAAVAGKPSVAAEVLRRMQAAGVAANVIAYTSLLSSYGATGDVEAAVGVLQQMEAAGCRPNAKTYTELMTQLAAKGRYEECERYFNKMVAEGCPADRVSYAILLDSMLHRWAADRSGQPALLRLIQARWDEAALGPLEPHTFLHQPQGRLTLDLHGYSAWTAQLAVLATLQKLMGVHAGGGRHDLSRIDIITGRGNRSTLRHRPVLRELVLEMLQHLVPVSIPRSNDGLLTLEVKRLRRLFDAMLASGSTFSLESMQHCLVEPPTDPPL